MRESAAEAKAEYLAEGDAAAGLTLTLTPSAGKRIYIKQLEWSLEDDPTAGSGELVIACDSTERKAYRIKVGGPGFVPYPDDGIFFDPDEAVAITLTSGNANTGTLSAIVKEGL